MLGATPCPSSSMRYIILASTSGGGCISSRGGLTFLTRRIISSRRYARTLGQVARSQHCPHYPLSSLSHAVLPRTDSTPCDVSPRQPAFEKDGLFPSDAQNLPECQGHSPPACLHNPDMSRAGSDKYVSSSLSKLRAATRSRAEGSLSVFNIG